ncbi:hypothetical protein DRQ09_00950 [candidate division KSB1 bacterium]|nr:MAG: hypothetical protein DRQ09_00950 [candidate division KSB1 bacterium]
MNTGEMLLVIGATIILGLIFLSVNNTIGQNELTLIQNELRITGVELTQEIIENSLCLSFDEVLVDSVVVDLPGALTSPEFLGPEPGETPSSFDDVDDYNGYSDTVKTPLINYVVTVSVAYVDTIQPDSIITSGPTFLKKMTVAISSPFFDDSIKNSILFSLSK